jgi:hypothetical protein
MYAVEKAEFELIEEMLGHKDIDVMIRDKEGNLQKISYILIRKKYHVLRFKFEM